MSRIIKTRAKYALIAVGDVFGRWTVKGDLFRREGEETPRCLCECSCGMRRDVAVPSLISGSSKSCGCRQSLVLRDCPLTADRVRELLTYDPGTGVFTWKFRSSRFTRNGKRAGSRNSLGYCVIGIDGKGYNAHRLALLYVEGVMPPDEVDHINGVRDDNRFSNLRHATKSTNMQNLRGAHKGSASGVLGVQPTGKGKWKSTISKNGKTISLGRFETIEAASAAYLAAKRVLHEGCTL